MIMFRSRQRGLLLAGMPVLLAALTGCGGGGGGSDAAAPDSTTAAVALSGTAAKGLMANADVKVHPVAADGSVNLASVLASTTTNANGQYSLNFAGAKDQPYVVLVSANANTTHLDEVTGQAQALPVGFSMRSLVVPDASGNISASVSVTPFSEMAVAAAANATGGVSTVNAAQSVSTVTQLLGFNPLRVAATTTSAAASDDEKKLAVMLTAVSHMASRSDLGCTGGTSGARVRCVVEKLGAAARINSIKLESSSGGTTTNVSAVLGDAVSAVLARPELVGSISGSLLTTAAANLACTTNCTAASTGTTPSADPVASAIAGAKLLFAQLKSDWTALFSRGGVTALASGASNVQTFKFEQAMRNVHAPVNTLVFDSAAILKGIDHFNRYMAGETTSATLFITPGTAQQVEIRNDGSADFSNSSTVACAIWQDTTGAVLATAPGNAVSVICSARYFISRAYNANDNGFVTSQYRHAIVITPDGTDRFAWQARARLTRNNQAGVQVENTNLLTDADGAAMVFSGTAAVTVTANSIRGFTLAGDLPGSFANDGVTLASHRSVISFTGTHTVDAAVFGRRSSEGSGHLRSYDRAGTLLSTLTVKNAQFAEEPVGWSGDFVEVAPDSPASIASGGGGLRTAALNLVFTAPDAEFEGQFAIASSTWDKSGTWLQPTEVRLTGMLRNISNGTANEFVNGSFVARSAGFAAYDATAAYSTSNRFSRTMSFVGQVTAPGRPLLELSLGAEQLMDSASGSTQSLNLQYRSIVNGVPRLVVNVAGTREGSSSVVNRLRLTEAANNLSMSWLDGASTVDLVQGGGRVIGSISDSGLVTFSDGSLVSLDVGL